MLIYQTNHTKVKNSRKVEEELQADTNHTSGFIDEILEEAMNTNNVHESTEETNYDYCNSEDNAHGSVSENNNFYGMCMNLLFLAESIHTRILNQGADACVLGKGLEVLSIYSSTRENVVVFDHETTIKRNLPIVSAITALDLTNGKSVILIIHESIHNETSNHSLSSQFKLREFGILIDSISHRHGGTQ
jgi:hypothetical protein